MANEKLRYRAELDSKNFEAGAKRIEKAASRVNRGVKRQGQAFTQLSYALDDAQYGFRGVQNNLQQLAITAGLSGPLVLGITGLTIGIGYLIDNFDKLIPVTDNSREALKKLNDEFLKLNEIQLSQDQKIIINAQNLENRAKKRKKEIEDEIKANNDLAASRDAEDFVNTLEEITKKNKVLKEELKSVNEQIFDAQATKQDAIDRVQLADDLAKNIKKVNTETNKGRAQFMFGPQSTDKFERYLDSLKDIGKTIDQIRFEKFNSDIAAVNLLFRTGVIDLQEYLDRLEELGVQFNKTGEKTSEGTNKISEADGVLNQGLSNIITGFATAVGQGDKVGDALLAGFGNILVQLGGLLIVTGLGIKAFKDSLSSLNPVVAVVAGAAMVAAGVAFSSAAKKAGGSGGSSGGYRGTQTSPLQTPNSIQGFGQGSGMQLVSTVRGQDLRFVLQAANDSYSARN